MSSKLFSPTINRWISIKNNNETVGNYTDQVFKNGYDDPTYLTFKIEFGDWGASVLGRNAIEKGTSAFKVINADYDQLPIGLLNCPAPNDGIDQNYWQLNAANNSTTFNDTNVYSAFSYLRSRNEDIRAEYMYYFVNGLLEIQEKYPYIFKKISGIDSLEQFNANQGQRLKDAKITLTCIEGLNLKIRTLFEMYRKAAWDDEYQRWILPENMREFKMIIYVFERRVFHDAVAYNRNNKTETAFVYSTLNGDLPVKAFECCPCEFEIKSNWKGDYEQDFTQGQAEETQLTIKVKNVKTYYKNGLLDMKLHNKYVTSGINSNSNSIISKIDTLMIYDLVESMERQQSIQLDKDTQVGSISNMTINGVRAMYMNKNILFENEENSANLFAYTFGKPKNGAISKQNITFTNISDGSISTYDEWAKFDSNKQKNYQINLNAFNKDSTNELNKEITFSPISEQQEIFNKTLKADLGYLYDNFRGSSWIVTLLQSPSYDPNRSFWANLGANVENLFFGARRQVLLGQVSGLTSNGTTNNILNYLIPGYIMPVSVATDIRNTNMNTLYEPRELNYYIKKRQYNLYGLNDPAKNNYNFLKQTLLDLENIMTKNNQIDKDKFDKLELTKKYMLLQYLQILKDNDDFIKAREHNDQILKLLDFRDIPYQMYMQLKKPRDYEFNDYAKLEYPRIIPIQAYNFLKWPRRHAEQILEILSKYRLYNILDYEQLDDPRIKNNDLIDIQFEECRDIDEQILVDLSNIMQHEKIENIISENINGRNYNEQEFTKLLDPRENNIEIKDELLDIVKLLPNIKYEQLKEIRKLPKAKLVNLKELLKNYKPAYYIKKEDLISMVDKAQTKLSQEFIEINEKNEKEEKELIDSLSTNVALNSLENIQTNDKTLTNLQNAKSFVSSFINNEKDINNAMKDEIINKQKKLQDLQHIMIKQLPVMDMYSIKDEKDEKDKDNTLLLSIQDMTEIEKNIKLLGLQDVEIKKLSYNSLIELNKEFEERIVVTQEMVGLTSLVDTQNKQKFSIDGNIENMLALDPDKKLYKKLGKNKNNENNKPKILY